MAALAVIMGEAITATLMEAAADMAVLRDGAKRRLRRLPPSVASAGPSTPPVRVSATNAVKASLRHRVRDAELRWPMTPNSVPSAGEAVREMRGAGTHGPRIPARRALAAGAAPPAVPL